VGFVELLYIDPGAGSMLIQMLIAAGVAVPFFLRTQIRRGIDRLRGRREGQTPITHAQTQPAREERQRPNG
jgi:hypothetical protein